MKAHICDRCDKYGDTERAIKRISWFDKDSNLHKSRTKRTWDLCEEHFNQYKKEVKNDEDTYDWMENALPMRSIGSKEKV